MQAIPRSTFENLGYEKILKKSQCSLPKLDFASFQFWYEEAKKSAKKVKIRDRNLIILSILGGIHKMFYCTIQTSREGFYKFKVDRKS